MTVRFVTFSGKVTYDGPLDQFFAPDIVGYLLPGESKSMGSGYIAREPAGGWASGDVEPPAPHKSWMFDCEKKIVLPGSGLCDGHMIPATTADVARWFNPEIDGDEV